MTAAGGRSPSFRPLEMKASRGSSRSGVPLMREPDRGYSIWPTFILWFVGGVAPVCAAVRVVGAIKGQRPVLATPKVVRTRSRVVDVKTLLGATAIEAK